ncbi:MAG TPA: pyridoxamine 5'-phosphate oxidase family protein [Actinomycetota bacterium]|nr:pyridoxamine 5'-phosphate oxidase family protein [Actinomycetota bacterium]
MSGELSGAQAAYVDAATVARLATVTLERTPHVVPVCPVLDLDRILIASGYDRKVANIRDNDEVCIVFDRYSDDWDELSQVVVYGKAYLVEEGPEFDRDVALLNEKFPQYPPSDYPIVQGSTVIIEIRPTRVLSSGV